MSGSRPLCVAVVDGYSAGALLARRLRESGARLLHVRSSPQPPPFYAPSFRPELFDENLPWEPNQESLAALLKERGVAAVVPGTESGVPLADRLAAALGLRVNDQTRPEARWDKAELARALRRAGLAAPTGRLVVEVGEAVGWWRGAGRPEVVVKPAGSAGGDGVRFCRTEQELVAALEAVLGAGENLLGRDDRRTVVQHLLAGPEFYLNTVSSGGVHRIVEIWRYHKTRQAGAPVYDYDTPVPADTADAQRLARYARRALDAVGLRHGPGHLEVILTSSGPVLIDLGARLGGCAQFPAVLADGFVSQVDAAAEWLLDPRSVTGVPDVGDPWPGRTVRRVALINRHPGVVRSAAWADELRSLPTAHGLVVRVAVGDVLGPTVDLASSPGFVYLVGSPAAVEADYRRLRAAERAAPYTRG